MKLNIAKMDLVELMAERIRTCYVELRRLRPGELGYTLHEKWDGGCDSKGRQHKNVWPSIAEFMFKHRLDAGACVTLCFEISEDRRYAPLPNAIAVPRLLEDYKLVSRVDTQHLRYALGAEKQLCRVQLHEANHDLDITGKNAWLYVLGNEELSLSPLFRFCLAYSENMESIVEQFKLDAVLQYVVAMDSYDKAWENWLPDPFKKQVRLAYDRTVAHRKDGNGKESTATSRRKKKSSR